MYIQNKLVAAFYKLSLGIIALYGFWVTLADFNLTAWRLFSTWALLIGAIYFCISALILALGIKREAGDTPCPMLEGMLIVAFITQAVAAISSTISDDYFPGIGGFAAVLVYYILPILTLLDWCLFNKKGLWRPMDPFYWLALPLAYAAMIILTANMLPSNTSLLYPVSFLDYNANGFWEMLTWLTFVGLLILIFGYIMILLDAFLGGIIAKHIVLPRIRTVTIEEEALTDETPIDSGSMETAMDNDLVSSEEVEIIEPDEIITAEPKTPRPEAANKQAKTYRAATERPKTATTPQKSSKDRKTTPKGKRKINDITRPQPKPKTK